MSEVLLLFVWSHSVEWSEKLAKNSINKKYDKIALRSICADNVEARTILANASTKIEGVPVLIAIEHKDGKKTTSITYERDEIRTILKVFGVQDVSRL